MNNKGKEVVLVISDTQFPFEHKDTFKFLAWAKKKYQPTQVVHIGDECDYHALGDWDHDPDGASPGDEARQALDKMHRLYKLFPKVKAVNSNHTDRPLRRAFKSGIPKVFIKEKHDFLEAPDGWEWRNQWTIDGVVYEHGEGFSGHMGALNCAQKNGAPTVIGHIHSHAGILYSANERDIIYGFNVGCLIDRHKYAFAYGRNLRHKPILSVGIVNKGIPTLVPMLLNQNGDWVKS